MQVCHKWKKRLLLMPIVLVTSLLLPFFFRSFLFSCLCLCNDPHPLNVSAFAITPYIMSWQWNAVTHSQGLMVVTWWLLLLRDQCIPSPYYCWRRKKVMHTKRHTHIHTSVLHQKMHSGTLGGEAKGPPPTGVAIRNLQPNSRWSTILKRKDGFAHL